MSGVVGSKLNIRGSGLVGSLGTDGQHLLSAGAGKTNVFETAAGGGKIGQVISAIKTDGHSTTSTSFTATGLAVAITPVATSSKVMIYVCLSQCGNSNAGEMCGFKIDGGNCDTYIGDAGTGFEVAAGNYSNKADYENKPQQLQYLDSPATTSEVTYALHWHLQASGTLYNNRVASGPHPATMNSASSMTVMEVLA